MSEKEDNPEERTLEQQLQLYHDAIQSEFTRTTAEVGTDSEAQTNLRKQFFRDNAPSAAAQIVWLANNADSEGVRLSAAKFVLAQAETDDHTNDPVAKILAGLQKNDAKEQPANKED